ncbi:MAG TPA: serine protease, partial [Myxococcales bacterium]|nr:serine protease [Myxococcales bacterium]
MVKIDPPPVHPGTTTAAAGQVIATALHGVIGCREVRVWQDRAPLAVSARVIAVDVARDLALLQPSSPLPGARALDVGDVASQQRAVAVFGYSHSERATAKEGTLRAGSVKATLDALVSEGAGKALLRGRGSPRVDVELLSLQISIAPGDSGGPVVTPEGLALGVASGGLCGGQCQYAWGAALRDAGWAAVNEAQWRGTATDELSKLLRTLAAHDPGPLFSIGPQYSVAGAAWIQISPMLWLADPTEQVWTPATRTTDGMVLFPEVAVAGEIRIGNSWGDGPSGLAGSLAFEQRVRRRVITGYPGSEGSYIPVAQSIVTPGVGATARWRVLDQVELGARLWLRFPLPIGPDFG